MRIKLNKLDQGCALSLVVKHLVSTQEIIGSNPIGRLRRYSSVVERLPPWHYDCVKNYDDPRRHEVHYIWQYGCGSATQFEGGIELEPEWIYTYGRALHAPSPAKWAGKRILVRKTYSDMIKVRK